MNEEENLRSRRGSLRRYIRHDLTILTWRSHSPFLANRVVLAVAGPAGIERAKDIDRSLLPSASPQE
jgi:hypothetical protein